MTKSIRGKARNAGRRFNNSGSVFVRNGVYVLEYHDIEGKRCLRTLTTLDPQTGKKINIITQPEAEASADDFLADLNKLYGLQTREEVILKVAEQKKLMRSVSLKIDDIWSKFKDSPTRCDAGDATLKGYGIIWRLFRKYLQNNYSNITSVAQVDTSTAENYFSELWNKSGISEQTYNNHLQVLNLIFKTLLGPDFTAENPFRDIQKKTRNTQKREALTWPQLQKVFELLRDESRYHILYKPEMRLLVKLMTYTGCRGEDAALMEWSNVHFSQDGRNVIIFTPEKNRRRNPSPVCVPIHSDLLFELREAVQRRSAGESLLLPRVNKRYLSNPTGISKDIVKLLKASGIKTQEDADHRIRRQYYTKPVLDTQGMPVKDRNGKIKVIEAKKKVCRYSMHSFRHTFVSLAANAGIPLEVVRAIVGHASDDMTRHYLHVTDERKNHAIDALPVLSDTISIEATQVIDRVTLLKCLTDFTSNCSDQELIQLLEFANRLKKTTFIHALPQAKAESFPARTPANLQSLLKQYSIETIGQIFEVTGTAIRKQILKYGIPRPSGRIQSGKLSEDELISIRESLLKK